MYLRLHQYYGMPKNDTHGCVMLSVLFKYLVRNGAGISSRHSIQHGIRGKCMRQCLGAGVGITCYDDYNFYGHKHDNTQLWLWLL